MKATGKRLLAGALGGVMALSLAVGGIASTLAQDMTARMYLNLDSSNPYSAVIYQAYNVENQAISNMFMYAYSPEIMEMGSGESTELFRAFKYGDDFFGDIGEDMNVFFKLDGEYHRWASSYICGGEALNPDTDPQPVLMADIKGSTFPLAGPYFNAQGERFYYMDADWYEAISGKFNTQSARGDSKLQGPEKTTWPVTDVTVFYDTSTGSITETSPRQEPADIDDTIIGPVDVDQDGVNEYLKPTGTENVYEVVVDKTGTSKVPPEYVYDKNTDGDKNPVTQPTDLVPAEKVEGGDATTPNGYYVEQPENIWHQVQPDGTIDPDDAVWGGADGDITTPADNKPAKGFGTDSGADAWFVDNGDNTFQPVQGSGNTQTGEIVGGGPDLNPATDPVTPIYTDPTSGKHYVGPVTNDKGEEVYYGDPATGGDGLINSTASSLEGDDVKYYKDPATGELVTDKPLYGPVDADKDGNIDDYLKPTGTENVYEVVDENGASRVPPEYVYDKNTDNDGDPSTGSDDLVPATKVENSGGDAQDGFYVKDSDVNNPGTEGIWHPVKPDGSVDPDTGVWAGPDEKIGSEDDVNADHVDTDFDAVPDTWYADHGDNIFTPVDGNGTAGDLVGGGPDKKPETAPVTPIYTHTDGTHFVGPMQDENGDNYYYGDPADGGDGLITSTASGTNGDDVVFYLDATGDMVTKKPPVTASGISLNRNSLLLVKNSSEQLEATLSPTHSTSSVSWTTTNTSVVTVSQNGTVTSVGLGKAYITATADGHSAVCSVEVVEGVALGDTIVVNPEISTLPTKPNVHKSLWGENLTFAADGYAWQLVAVDMYGNYLVTSIDAEKGTKFTIQMDRDGNPSIAGQDYFALAHYDNDTGTYRDNKTKFGSSMWYSDTQALGVMMSSIYTKDLVSLKNIVLSAELPELPARTLPEAVDDDLMPLHVNETSLGRQMWFSVKYSKVASSGNYYVFPLNGSELLNLMSITITNADDTRVGKYSNGEAGAFWSRGSCFSAVADYVIITDDKGFAAGFGVGGSSIDNTYAARPAMWIRINK